MQNINKKSIEKESRDNTERIMQKKIRGQAAVEFLVTYGWAILAAMIVVGALAYFGIFNTQRYVNDVCYFGDQLICEDYAAYQNGTVAIQLRNNFGVPIDIDTIRTIAKSDYGTVTCFGITPNSSIDSGKLFEVRCKLVNGTISTNNKLKYKATIVFRNTGSGNWHNQTGDLTVTVQK